MDEFRLPRHGAHGVCKGDGAPLVAVLARRGVGVRTGRNDRRHVHHIVRPLHEPCARLRLRNVAEQYFQALPVLAREPMREPFVLLSAREQHAHPLHPGQPERLAQRLRAHIPAHTRHGDLHVL